MAKKFFENSISDSDSRRTLRVAGALYSSSTPVEAYPGTLAVQSSLLDSEAYSGMKNPNSWKMTKATQADRAIHVCDPDAVNTVTDGVKYYNLGAETLGVRIPAGEKCAWQRLEDGDTFVWGDGCFAALPSATEKYAVVGTGADAGLWTPVENEPTTGTFIEILDAVNIDTGNILGGSGYLCKVGIFALASGPSPDAPVITTSTDPVTSTPLSLAGTCVADATVKIYDNDTYKGKATVSGTSWSFSLTVADGEHSVTAVAILDGLVSAESDAYEFTVAIA